MTKEEFSELFPKKELIYNGKIIATIKPIPISKMDKVIGIVVNLVKKVQDGTTPEHLPLVALTDLMQLIPYSVETELDELPGVVLPEVLSAMVDLNLTEVVLKNWLALLKTVEKVSDKLPEELKEGGKK